MQKIPFEDLPSTNTLIDATNLNTMQGYIEDAIDNKIGLITLLEANSTAPEQCETGDLYYNTDTALIYEATGTDTWNTVGDAPDTIHLYLDMSNFNLYYYSEIETKLLDCGRIILPDLTSDSETNAPSVKAVNDAIDEINSDIIDTNERIDDLAPVVLWSNDSYSTFARQTIDLSSNDYSFLEIYYINYNDSNFRGELCCKVEKNKSTMLQALFVNQNYVYIAMRAVAFADSTHLLMHDAVGRWCNDQGWTTETQNNTCIPMKILGYK